MTDYVLSESLAYQFVRLAQAASNALTRRLVPYDLSSFQWFILAGLNDNDGMTPTEVRNELERDLPSVLRIIWSLEKRGYVRRKRNPADRRSYTLHLTQAGRDLLDELAPVIVQLKKDAYGHLDPAYVEQMKQTVMELRAVYDSLVMA